MDEKEAGELLRNIEGEVSKGNFALREMGFWKLVDAAKRDKNFAEKFADRIADIDRKAFKNRAWFTVSLTLGHAVELLGVILGIALLIAGLFYLDGAGAGISVILAAAIFSATLHPFAHYVVGRTQGIKFSYYFPDGPALIEPTLKIDYASYLRASAKGRALMHLAGPISTSLGPFVVLVLSAIYGIGRIYLAVVLLILLFMASSEFVPLIAIKLGKPKILFADFRKSDTIRTLREWNIYKEQSR